LIIFCVANLLVFTAVAQPPANQRSQKPKTPPKRPKLPEDPQLLSLHKEFVVKAEKLAV